MHLRLDPTYERAVRLHNLAARYQAEGLLNRPEKLYLRSLALKQQIFGPNHIEAALTLNNLGLFYKTSGRLADARRAYQRAVEIMEREKGVGDADVDDIRYNLTLLDSKESERHEARARFVEESRRALADPGWREQARIRPEYAQYRLEVGPSRIHRFGVFAAETIPADADIIEYTGKLVSRRHWQSIAAREPNCLCRINPYWCLDGSVEGSGAEFVNHCCEPNTRFRREGIRAWIASLRPIEAGEELLLDYRFPKNGPPVPCYCGAPLCRGTINLIDPGPGVRAA